MFGCPSEKIFIFKVLEERFSLLFLGVASRFSVLGMGGRSSVGRAVASQAAGRRFETDRPLHFTPKTRSKTDTRLMGSIRS